MRSFLLLATSTLALDDLPRTCSWAEQKDPRCEDDSYTWHGAYPECTRFQYADGQPIPCQGNLGAGYCDFESDSPTEKPQPASYHVHVFLPNTACKDCDDDFKTERPGFTFEGGMALRRELAEEINRLSAQILGRPLQDPINASHAGEDPRYNQCGKSYNIVAGAPANYHDEPCAFEVDAVTEPGPFVDPQTGKGYPNYSFFIPGDFWIPGLMGQIKQWFLSVSDRYGAYDVLLHPNTGCEVRDHIEQQSIDWLGKGYALNRAVFSCEALGCNQACPSHPHGLQPPANCSQSSHDALGWMSLLKLGSTPVLAVVA